LIPALVLLLLAACATGTRPDATGGVPDPLEPLNRQVLTFNEKVDDAVLRPVAEAYRDVVPPPVRTGIRNVLANLNEPLIFANNILQARFLDAGHTVMRFYFNTTAGLGGIFDVATAAGIERRTGDFGQTLHAWGVPDGPYLVLPLLGPGATRDQLASGVDALAHPVGLATGYAFPLLTARAIGVGRGAVGGLDLRAENIQTIDALRNDSFDYYARLRSFVTQRRAAQLGRSLATEDGPAPLDDPAATPQPLDDPGMPALAAPPGPAELRLTSARIAPSTPASPR
jgi:phospholipid-binding lipoprotein MlaA